MKRTKLNTQKKNDEVPFNWTEKYNFNGKWTSRTPFANANCEEGGKEKWAVDHSRAYFLLFQQNNDLSFWTFDDFFFSAFAGSTKPEMKQKVNGNNISFGFLIFVLPYMRLLLMCVPIESHTSASNHRLRTSERTIHFQQIKNQKKKQFRSS